MDAPENDRDAYLQRTSSDLITDFDSSLKPLLWITGKGGRLTRRQRVCTREVERLVALLEPFQELPQLLDPHLEKFVPSLANALITSLRPSPSIAAAPLSKGHAKLIMPLCSALSILLYTFCKIRGEKVIVRFFSTETRHLEVLLNALEDGETNGGVLEIHPVSGQMPWIWEQRFICILWMSHLLLVPFDLATISSDRGIHPISNHISGLHWPNNMPNITKRVVPLAIRYISSAGKERDSAKHLLVRIALRKDMQELGLLSSLVEWAVSSLQSFPMMPDGSIYYCIGILSFLGGLLISSANSPDMDPYLSNIFRCIKIISNGEDPVFKVVQSSAVARKSIIKILRAATVLLLLNQSTLVTIDKAEMLEETVTHLLEALADNDTPVRLAASKAISVIMLKLAPSMGEQIVDAVLDSLNYNVLRKVNLSEVNRLQIGDLSAVNPLEWHGLIMTLSNLLYRRSPPEASLPDILRALLIGLKFEQRSTSGSSIGSNIRDAACFGLWALARRYTTSELQRVKIASDDVTERYVERSSTVQLLATELVVAGSLDPVGNIRRGASAALQELIGRHPDVVSEGIAVVQIVDYSAVAFRTRAVLEVSVKSARLSRVYEDALVDALLGWRGIGDGDASSRRTASVAIGKLVRRFRKQDENEPWNKATSLVLRIEEQFKALQVRDNDRRHGLLLSMASVLSALTEILNLQTIIDDRFFIADMLISSVLALQRASSILQDSQSFTNRRPELIAEAGCRIIAAICPLVRTAHVLQEIENSPEMVPRYHDQRNPSMKLLLALVQNAQLHLEKNHKVVELLLQSLETMQLRPSLPLSQIIAGVKDALNIWMLRTEGEVIEASIEAAVSVSLAMNTRDRKLLVEQWLGNAQRKQSIGHLFALVKLFSIASYDDKDNICQILLGRWETAKTVETKVSVLRCLAQGSILVSRVQLFTEVISSGLDDYTTDSRGDVGSLVRVEALKAAGTAFTYISPSETQYEAENRFSRQKVLRSELFRLLYEKVLRLAAEKLDRVRNEAQMCLASTIFNKKERERYLAESTSSYGYFRWLLDLQVNDWLCVPLSSSQSVDSVIEFLEGYVTSADSGSDNLIRSSRAALVDFCDPELRNALGVRITQTKHLSLICDALFRVIKKNLSNDRVLVPAMEVASFLFDGGIMQQSGIEWRSLFLAVQKAHYKTANIRKLEAAINIYGHLLDVQPEALQKLTTMLLHPFPSIRSRVADTLFITCGVGRGVNWAKARKIDLIELQDSLDIRHE